MLESTPKTTRSKTLPTVAPFNVVVYKVIDRAGDIWEQFKNSSAKLWQVPIHNLKCVFCLRVSCIMFGCFVGTSLDTLDVKLILA